MNVAAPACPLSNASFDAAALPRIEDLPIPEDIRPAGDWSPLLLEMASHIGASATLRLCDRFGGMEIAISKNTVGRFADTLSPSQMQALAFAFHRGRIVIPVAARQILHVKRAGVLALVRSGALPVAAAALVLRTPRRYITHLINATTEGVGVAPVPLPPRREVAMLDLATRAIEATLSDAGIPSGLIAASKARLFASASNIPAWSNA